MMRTSQRVRTLWLGISLCAVVSFAGCGHREGGPLSEGGENSPAAPGAKPAEASIEQQTEQKLDPLTKDDVELYLKVMRAAAKRVKNPAPADKASLEGATKIFARSASGHVPTQDDVKTLERANLVALSMDQIVADEMKIDGRTYRGIVEAVESAVQDPARVVVPGKGGQPAPDHPPTPLEERLSGVNAANVKFLAPYRDEILRLLPIVRNPANLPK
jgi:hypothetical protein